MLSEIGMEQCDSLEDGKGVVKPSSRSGLEREVAGVGKRVEMQDGFKGGLQVSTGSIRGS